MAEFPVTSDLVPCPSPASVDSLEGTRRFGRAAVGACKHVCEVPLEYERLQLFSGKSPYNRSGTASGKDSRRAAIFKSNTSPHRATRLASLALQNPSTRCSVRLPPQK
jgi:hypothetical protein